MILHITQEVYFSRLKRHGNEADFLRFSRNGFLMSTVHYLSSHSKFGFEFAEIFIIEKRLSDSPSQGVDDSPIRRVKESSTNRLGESANEFLKEKSLPW
jgi:hypothetical protein